MFPLFDLEGNVVAFSGRIYNSKDSSKDINTKETAIVKKGNIVYSSSLLVFSFFNMLSRPISIILYHNKKRILLLILEFFILVKYLYLFFFGISLLISSFKACNPSTIKISF